MASNDDDANTTVAGDARAQAGGVKSSVVRKGTRFGGKSAVKKSFGQESVQVVDAAVDCGGTGVELASMASSLHQALKSVESTRFKPL